MKPEDIDDFLVWAAIGVVARRARRLHPVLRSAALSRQSARHLRGLAGRHVVPWRLSRHHARHDPVRPRARHFGLDAVRRRRRRRAGRRSASCASPTSSTPSCGAGRPTCPGRSSSRTAGRSRAIRASSTKPRSKGSCCSSSCACSPTRFLKLKIARLRRRRLRRRLWRCRASSSSSSASRTSSSAICSAAG